MKSSRLALTEGHLPSKWLLMDEEHIKTDEQIISEQLDFFIRNASGCGFAVIAARAPERFGWRHEVISACDSGKIDGLIEGAIASENTGTLSIIFRDVDTDQKLDELIPKLNQNRLYLHQEVNTDENRCYQFRARINDEESYVSGFGTFQSMPITRRTPYSSIVLRVKPRPAFDWHLQKPEEGIVHVADLLFLFHTRLLFSL